MQRRAFKFLLNYSVCSLALFSARSALAQSAPTTADQGIADIVVTAQKRGENLQDVPVSVAAFSAEDLSSRGLGNVEDLSTNVSGLQIGKAGGVIQPFLRGVGNSSSTIGNESSVATYIDGQYFSRLSVGLLSLANAERVEILKGPQGTLFGRNSSGGVIQVITQDPSHTPLVKGNLSYSRFSTVEGAIYASTGLSEKLAVDISFAGRKQEDGWGINETTGNRAGFLDYWTVRSKLLFEPGEGTRITLIPHYSWSRSSLQGNVSPGTIKGSPVPGSTEQFLPLDNFWDHNGDVDGRTRSKTWGVVLKGEQELGFADLTSITGYVSTTTFNLLDSDYSPRPDWTTDYGGPIKQFTQELQLGSRADSPVKWIVGLFYYNTTSRYVRFSSRSQTAFASIFNGNSMQKAKSYSAYGQATYEILPRLSLTGGLRHTWDRTRARGGLYRLDGSPLNVPLPNQQSIDKLTFKAGADYKFTDDVMAYGSFSRGYKSAVFNLLAYNRNPNKPEIVDSYEIGLKTTLLDRRLRINIAGFWNDISNPQVSLIQAGTVLFSNAGSARSRGVDVDLQAAVSSGLTLRASASYVDSVYTDYANAPSSPPRFVAPYGGFATRQVDATGNHTPQAPEFTSNIGFDYVLRSAIGEWTFTADFAHNSGYYFEPDNFLKQQSFNLISGQIKLRPTDNLAVRVFGRNLANEKIMARGSSTAGYIGFNYQAAEPRVYGVGLDFNF